MTRDQQKIMKFMEFCESLAELSTCKRNQCGAIILPFDCTSVRSIGYNGPPRGVRNDSCTEVEGDCGCVHAETNAVIKFGYIEDRRPHILYSTTAPCKSCASLILNCPPIETVIYSTRYRNDLGIELLFNHGVRVMTKERWLAR